MFFKIHRFTLYSGLILLCGLVLSLGAEDRASGNGIAKEIRISSGDTLWSIAREHNQPGRDVRELVSALRHLNDLKGDPLQIGQALRIPANW